MNKPENKNGITGRNGEEIVNEELNNEKSILYKTILSKLDKSSKSKRFKLRYQWINKDKEARAPFDFIVDGKLFEIKTTDSENPKPPVFSSNEMKLVSAELLFVVMINYNTIKKSRKGKNWFKVYTPKEVASLSKLEIEWFSANKKIIPK